MVRSAGVHQGQLPIRNTSIGTQNPARHKPEGHKIMKTYEVELKRTSYVQIRVDANSKEEAEQAAWYELQNDGSYGIGNDADWEVEAIDEITE